MNCCKNYETSFGCYIGHIFAGAFGYADDILILSPSKYATEKMLMICESYSDMYKVSFNANKTKLLYFDGDDDVCTGASLVFQGKSLPVTSHDKHLGIIIGKRSHETNIDACVNNFSTRVDAIVNDFSKVDPHIRYQLFKTYCMSLYGCVLWDLSNPYVNHFYIAWRKAIRKLLHTL